MTDFLSSCEIEKDSEPSGKRKKISLFSFISEEEQNVTQQSHSGNDHGINKYVKSLCASMEINPLQF